MSDDTDDKSDEVTDPVPDPERTVTDPVGVQPPRPPDEPATPPVTVEVIEPPIPDRVRRPSDLATLVVAFVVLVGSIALAVVAVDTAGAIEHELAEATGGLPLLLLQILGWAAGIGIIVLPLAVVVDLVVRSRLRLLGEALAAAFVGGLVVIVLDVLILEGHMGALLDALTKPIVGGRSAPFDAVVASLVAMVTVATISGRKWLGSLAVIVVVASIITQFLGGYSTALAQFCSLLLGWIIGLAFRYAFGAVSTRPPGTQVAEALVAAGIPLTRLELVDPDDDGERRYTGTTTTLPVDVQVMDRDTFGFASGRRLLRALRLRSGSTRAPALTFRAELEHRTLMGLAMAQAKIPAPRPVAVCEVGPFSAALAYVNPTGTPISELGSQLDDRDLAQVWSMFATLQRRRIAHRGLGPSVIMLDDEGRAGLFRVGGGDIAADDLTLRLDTAQILTTVALAVGPERTVSSAVEELGEEAVLRAVAVLQPLALNHRTRVALKQHKEILPKLREEILALRPAEQPPPPIELRRVSARTIVTVLGGVVAAFVILPQLAQVDFAEVIATAQWDWAVGSVVFAATTFAAASVALTGAVNIHLKFLRTYMTQLAVAFTGLVAPAAVGNIALNTRYLQRAGLSPAVSGASVGVAQAAQFCSYFVLLIVSGVLAGTGPRASFTPPTILVVIIPAVILILLGLLAVPRVRKMLTEQVLPQVRSTVPQVLSVLQHPVKVAQLLGGALLLDLSFVAALVCATRAFGADPPVAAVAVVYFAGAIIGSAVPTPGGLGGIEAAMSAGLVAIGVDGGTAVSAVLLYRIATYWIPIPFGWFALNRLQSIGAI